MRGIIKRGELVRRGCFLLCFEDWFIKFGKWFEVLIEETGKLRNELDKDEE